MKKKGFTLIELLAVIVVLAIVALITVPVILNVIERVRKESYRDSVYGIMESGKIYLSSHIDSISAKDEIIFTCDGDKCTSTNDELSFKGSVPKSGSIYISGNGLIEIESLYNGKYYANGTNEEGIEITEEDSTMTRSELEEAILTMQEEINGLKQENGQLRDKYSDLQGQITSIGGSATSIDEVYPVGSIYITLSDVNPSTLFPDTTWKKYSEGKTLVGDDGTNYITGTTGGSSTVTLTKEQIPNLNIVGETTINSTTDMSLEAKSSGEHTHISSLTIYTGVGGYGHTEITQIVDNGIVEKTVTRSLPYAGNHTHVVTGTITIPKLTVSGKYENSNQTSISVQNPYTVVYMWKRVS